MADSKILAYYFNTETHKNLGTRYQMQIRWKMEDKIPASVMHYARMKEVI